MTVESTSPAARGSETDSGLRGRVVEVHLKPEVPGERGLPKRAVPEIRLREDGVEGDFNRYRHEERHDDPAMAVLLLPRETLAELNREGWPVRPGDLGENLTTEGIPPAEFRPGLTLEVGEAVVEISKPCEPCDNLYLLPYVGRSKGPEFVRTMLDRRGWYARVRRRGRVRAGDAVREADSSVVVTP